MKLVTFSCRGRTSIGKIAGNQVLDLPASDARLPMTMRQLLAAGPQAMQWAREVDATKGVAYPLADVRLEAPVPDPGKYLAIGMNYAKHVEEARRAGIQVPDTQVWFNKQASCINGPFDPVHMPRVSDNLDYEAELGVVIGRRCRHVDAKDARSVIAGYLVCNDVSVRDWQMRSATMTLEPGDVLATGTPSGVGAAMKPPTWLQIGDVVRVEIDGIGYIQNTVIREPHALPFAPD